ncbi:MAG TPA: zinc ABC transporter substrate-binding protein [Acidimicrobiales bacterium]|nr:zinc ABC transporter substrate-binding protein [Acidimicrobiales bacterium]
MSDSLPQRRRARTSRRARNRLLACSAVAAAVAVGVAGCSSSSKTAAPSGTAAAALATPTKTLNVVAGENFWGSIVSQLAGKAANVTSIVTDPNADPHNYESSSDDARAFATADYVVLNGAGYDAWADKLLSGNPNSKRKVFTISDLLGKKEGDIPHFWYAPDYVSKITNQVEADLKVLDPADSAYFSAQRQAFDTAMVPYRNRLATIKAKFSGVAVAATEDIFVYLAQYLGLDVISPPEFMRAVAEGNDPPAPSVAQFQDQIKAKQAKVLVYNLQTSTAVTTTIKKLAAQAEIPTIGVTETIQPPDATFEQWFDSELIALQNALNANALSGGGGSGP